MTSGDISEGSESPDRTRGRIGPQLEKGGTADATAQRWGEGEVVRVAGWKSSQNEVGTEPGEVSRARALRGRLGRERWALGSHEEG